MELENTKKTRRTKKRLILTDSRAVRNSLCILARQYLNNEIPDVKIRNLIYNLNSILQADRLINIETELTGKYEQLERLMKGEGGTVIDPKEIDNPYAQNLKKQLTSEQRVNKELQNDILELKRHIAGIQSIPTDTECVDSE